MLPYLLLTPEDAPQRKYPLREILNAALWIGRAGSQWEYLPHEFPPYKIVHQQVMRWFEHGCFESMAQDLAMLRREEVGRNCVPSVALIDSRTLQSTPESGHRAGYDGGKKRRGSKLHAAVDTMGHAIALLVTPADEQDREQVYELCQEVRKVTGENVDVVIADGGYRGEQTEIDAAVNDVELFVMTRPQGGKGFVLISKRWVVERSFGWTSRFRRLGRDLERLSTTLLRFHWMAFGVLLVQNLAHQFRTNK